LSGGTRGPAANKETTMTNTKMIRESNKRIAKASEFAAMRRKQESDLRDSRPFVGGSGIGNYSTSEGAANYAVQIYNSLEMLWVTLEDASLGVSLEKAMKMKLTWIDRGYSMVRVVTDSGLIVE
jgi:hypothetical protein